MTTPAPPFRAETIGSLLRPASLKGSFQQYREGRIDAAAYEAALTKAIRGAVRAQEDAVPARKHVVLGLVSTKRAALESPDELRRRIDEAARHVPLERLALSPQCGFASVAGGNLLTEEEQAAKLRRVVEVAAATWGH